MKRKRLKISIALIAGVLICAGIVVHELIHLGNQSRLFFPSLQRASSFQEITGVPYSGEKVLYFEYGSDWDADSWYYLAAQVSESTLLEIIQKKNLTKQTFSPETLGRWRFNKITPPKNPEYYTVTFSRKGVVHLWYDRESHMLYLVDEWIG
jgi:hypothetical protein